MTNFTIFSPPNKLSYIFFPQPQHYTRFRLRIVLPNSRLHLILPQNMMMSLKILDASHNGKKSMRLGSNIHGKIITGLLFGH